MSECLFEGHLPEVKGPESNILAVVEELVTLQSIASPTGHIQQTPF